MSRCPFERRSRWNQAIWFLILVYIQKTNKTKQKKTQYDKTISDFGAFTFWPTYKVVHFPKIGTKQKKKKRKKKLDTSALARKEPRRKLVVCETCFLGCGPRPGPPIGPSAPCCSGGVPDPVQWPLPQTDPPHLRQRRA